MAQEQFEIDKLKNDPDLWKRLCAYNEKTGQMEHLFKDKENPFTRGGDAPMNRIREVAEKGNLYMREHGRARHFRKADLEENQLKLGDMREAKLSRTSDPFMTGLLWATRGYLRWIGLNWVANWLDKRMQKRAERRQEDLRYREEFDSLSDDQKKDMKKLRKEEKEQIKQQKKAENLAKKQEKEQIKQQKKIEKLAKELEKAQQQLNKLQGKPVTTKEIPKTDPPEQDKNKEAKTTKKKVKKKTKKKVKVKPKEKSKVENKDLKAEQQPPEQQVQQQPPEQQVQQQPPEQQQILNGDDKAAQMQNPLDQANLNENKVSMQPNEMENQTNLREQLAKEKQQLDDLRNWKDNLSNSLFPPEQGAEPENKNEQPEANRQEEKDLVSSAVYGILGGNAANPEQKQEFLNKLLNGEQLGVEHSDLIRQGINEFTNAVKAEGKDALKQIMGNAIKELSQQASREESFSMRHGMIGRLISNGQTMANSLGIKIPLSEHERTEARGAVRMGTIAREYYMARQYLGNNLEKMNTKEGMDAVDKLMTGNTVKQMFQVDKQPNNGFASTQNTMGKEDMYVNEFRDIVKLTNARRTMQQADVKQLLENPDSAKAFSLGQQVTDGMVDAIRELDNQKANKLQKQNVANLDQAEPQINPLANATR